MADAARSCRRRRHPAPAGLLLLAALSCLPPSAFAGPQGFLPEDGRPRGFDYLEQSNTIASIHALAEDGDYILLQGHFVERRGGGTFIFEDLTGDTIRVSLSPSQQEPLLEVSYLIFAVVRTGLFSKHLDLQQLSSPRI